MTAASPDPDPDLDTRRRPRPASRSGRTQPAGAAVEAASGSWSLAVKDARRELLLEAARAEFGDKGLEGATMRSIALRARCTTGAIYPLFESKEAIYAALLADSLARLDIAVGAAMAATTSPRARLEAGSQAFIDHYLAHRFEVNLGLYAFRGLKPQGVGDGRDQALNAALLAVLDRFAPPLAELQGKRRDQKQPDQVRPLVALLFSQMIGALVLQLAGRLEILDVDARRLISLLLDQWMPDPGRRPGRSPGKPSNRH